MSIADEEGNEIDRDAENEASRFLRERKASRKPEAAPSDTDLADLISSLRGNPANERGRWPNIKECAAAADALERLAASQPVQVEVTTVRQMRELPRDTVVLSRTGSAYTRTDEGWRSWYTDRPLSDELMFEPWMLGGPFTIVHRPATLSAALGGGDHAE